MTIQEAEKIARIIVTADGGCRVCVQELASEMQEMFPEFEWIFDKRGFETGGDGYERLTVRKR